MINVKHLYLNLGNFSLEDINLEVKDGEYFVILGPTGAGKTLLLESIAGLYPLKRGEVWLRGKDVTGIEPEKRRVSIVYQDHALFPHLSVRDNISYGLRMQKYNRQSIVSNLDWVVGLLSIDHLLHRKPETLSGGEKQKVALARAIITKPDLLLLDEPLSALDPSTRETVQQELRRLHREMGITTLHVTHDFEEAIALATRIGVIGEGRVQQVGTPEEVFHYPNSEFVARFALTRNVFSGIPKETSNGDNVMAVGGTDFIVASPVAGKQHITIRPEDIILSTHPVESSARNSFQGRISQVLDKGSILYITVSVPPDFSCLITRRSFEEMILREDKQVFITFKASAVHLF